ncbi:AraC family transcriptional regulator [Paenibacillus mesophilus]|uniref:AraC family transcriptional regulator n=1 Tax=Paenibacillus mesophilus TaxID=2582849 RepID=UPI00110DC793|nr:AraC family transcriptional regulator [Paenibacillus mesophilus]TMV52160.1 AraC family transcriptional regulator [Paenibacillus mesophilus]
MMLKRYPITRDIVIDKLISCHYFELAKNYWHRGERHDFWELVYIDRGELSVSTDTSVYELKQGDMLVYEPNEFHRPSSNGKIAANMYIVTFECSSPALSFFAENKRFHLGNEEIATVSLLMKEGWNTFGPNPVAGKLSRQSESPFGSEQLFVLYLELLLLQLIRKAEVLKEKKQRASIMKERQEVELIDKVTAYMKDHLIGNLTLAHLCETFSVGRTHLSVLFKAKYDCGVLEYWNRLKVDKAKEHIRQNSYNLTEISELLGYNSLHYFSRQFKKTTGMTPSEYAKVLRERLFKQITD